MEILVLYPVICGNGKIELFLNNHYQMDYVHLLDPFLRLIP